MALETFEAEDPESDPTLPDGMDGWFEIFDADEEAAWIACDTTMEVER